MNWQDAAQCRGEEVALFFGREGETRPGKDAREEEARGVCGGCLVRLECLAWSLERPEQYGIWGGMDEDERANERRRRRRRALAAVPDDEGERVA